jgi:hypothetical protein
VRNGKGGALGSRWQEGAEDTWVLEVLGWHSWCGGVLRDG